MSVVMDGGYRQSTRAAMGPPYEGHHGSSHCLSQPDPAAVELRAPATNYQSLTLPRPPQQRRSNGAPAANPRRQLVSSRVSDYLKSLNSMARSIVLEKEYVEERHASEWRRMDEALQEEVVDDYFMPPDVHAHYGTLPRSHGRSYRSPASPTSDERFSFRNARVLSTLSKPPDPSTVHPPHSPPTGTYFIPPTHNRLHKNQLSYRSKALRKVMNLPPTSDPTNSAHYQQHRQSEKRDSGLGSDGESPRTSDEDQNPLGFHRNHLRSFSLRQKRGGGRGSLARSSTRRAPTQRNGGSEDTRSGGSSRPTAAESRLQEDRGYDAEVDLPDDSLLHDQAMSSTGTTHNQTGLRTPPKPLRYSSRTRRSLRMQPRVLADKFSTTEEEEEKEEVVVIPNFISRVASNSSTSTAASTFNDFNPSVPVYRNHPAVVLTNLRRVHSEDSIDTDTESIAHSNMSLLSKSTGVLTEDEMLSDANTVLTCPTPDTLLLGSSAGLGTKRGGGLVRSRPQSRRGGSFLQTSTSEFANRRAQFKPNMLRNQLSTQNSPAHTRQSTPCFSRQNTPGVSSPTPSHSDTPTRAHPGTPHLKTSPAPSSLSLKQRHNSASDSIDVPISPECLSSPPHTPLVKTLSAAPHNHRHHLNVQEEQKRESGYISSSSESFPFLHTNKVF